MRTNIRKFGTNVSSIILITLLGACTSNKELNCNLIPLSKACHHNAERLGKQNQARMEKCKWDKYELEVAKKDQDKSAIKELKHKIDINCVAEKEL